MNSLCQLASNWQGDLPPAGMACEEKRDGIRALFFRGHDGQPRLWSRNGYRIEGAGHILHRLGLLERVAGQPLFIDGEFVVGDSLAETKRWFESAWKLGGEAGLFFAFDVVPMVNWVQGHWDWPWHRRKAWLVSLAKQVEADASLSWEWPEGSRGRWGGENPVHILADNWAFDAADVIDEARRVWAREGEGVMLKDPCAPYQRKRSDAWLKVRRDTPAVCKMVARLGLS